MTELSPKVKPKKADKWAAKLGEVLYPGEVVWALCTASRFKPLSSATAITNARIVGFAEHQPPEHRVVYQVWADRITSFDLSVKKRGIPHLVVETQDDVIGFGSYLPEEHDFLRHYLSLLQRQGVDPSVVLDAPRDSVGPRLPQIPPLPRIPVHVAPPATPSVPQSPSTAPPPPPPRAAANPPTTGSGIADEIERLAGLFQRGLLDADEFRAAKQVAIDHLGAKRRNVSLQKGN